MSLLTKLNMNEPVPKSSEQLLNFRLFFFGVAWIHLVIVAMITLSADFTMDQDPRVKDYCELKFKFITAWFNLMLLVYFPLCFYCDWKEKCNQEKLLHVGVLRKVRDLVFTSILFPTILFADILFWRLYHKDITLITPKAVFTYVPHWCQHSLHTVSMITIFIDLLTVFRQRPMTLRPRFMFMTCFFFIYALVIYQSHINGHVVYRVFEVFTAFQSLLLITMCYLEYTFYFIVQWYFIDYVWDKHKIK